MRLVFSAEQALLQSGCAFVQQLLLTDLRQLRRAPNLQRLLLLTVSFRLMFLRRASTDIVLV